MGLRAILLPAFFVLAVLAAELEPNLFPGYGNQSILYFFALVIAGMVILYVFIPRWFGFKRVIDTGTGEQLNAQIQKIKCGHVAGVTAAVVLRCSPASWRTVVKRAQEFATVVVIDVTDLSENVGATPVMAMLHALAAERSQREIWWIHGARNRVDHAFAEETRSLLKQLSRARGCIVYSRPLQLTMLGQTTTLPGTLT
jgi:hypothetical protein